MRITILALVAIGCGGRAPEGAAMKREVGAEGPTSLAAARVSYGALVQEEAPPISLTTSDGTGLELVKLDARAVVDGPLAFTELRLRFQNPEDRVLEGRFAITLPENAAISRFAMEIDGRWMEAEMVERQAARRAYEDFLHRRQDPALLEKEAGNEFRARVFPIPARGVKDLIVSYSQELPRPDAPYVLPLRGLPTIREVTARVLAGDRALTLEERDWRPDRDLAAPASAATHALGAGHAVVMRIAPELGATRATIARATILVDTSASRALGFPAYAREVDALVAALARDHAGLEVTVAAFDQGVEELYRGRAADAAGKVEAALLGRMPLGASDLAAALRWAKDARGRLVVVTDAVATAGALESAALGEAAAALASDRIDVVLAGGIRERAVAEALTRGRRPEDGAVLDLDDGAAEVARRLALATRSGITVAVDGAQAVWPERLDGVQPGDAAMVYAWFSGDAPRTVEVTLGGDRRRVTVEPAAAPLVERAAAQAEVARLEAQLGDAKLAKDPEARQALVDRIVALSTSFRVLSSHTALLVLETEDDYRRFGIDRKALAGILIVGERGVEVQQRDDVAVIARDAADDGERTRGAKGDEGKDLAMKRKVEPEEKDEKEDKKPADEDDALPDPAKPEPPADRTATLAPPPPPSPEPSSGALEGQLEVEEPRAAVVSGGAAGAVAGVDGRLMARDEGEEDVQAGPPAYTGRMATVMDLIAARRASAALDEALDWRGDDPADVLALVALGEALEADGKLALAGRAYGSLIDLFPARADLRRFAGERLDRLADRDAGARALAIDSYRRAVEQRPDHLTGHRLLAMALVRDGQLAEAFAALERGLAQSYPAGRFEGGERILREDLGLVGAAWRRAEPGRAREIERRLRAARAELATAPSLRFVLTWETDANDVDFHIRDARKGHAFYSQRQLPSGGELYADVTTGYGPECFTIPGKPTAAPYQLSIHYYARGPMGYGMGKLEIVRHDGRGTLTFEERPFVVMNDQAYVDLGSVE